MTELKTLNYDNIPASTRTFILKTNLVIDIKKLFEKLPITEYIVIPKKRGRKKKNAPKDPNNIIPDGSIITLEYENNIRGVKIKKKKKSNGRINFFRNSTTVVMMIKNKIINFKISNNGKFQMTGCKFIEHAEECMKYIWFYIKDTDYYKCKNDNLEVLFVPSMRNIDFDIGYTINREALDRYINTHTEYRSLLETSAGYTGVNIKFPFDRDISEIKITHKTWIDGKFQNDKIVSYNTYIETESEKDRRKKLQKKRYTTFLVFYSGKVIMSSISKDFGKKPFQEFVNILLKNRHIFEEKLDV
jgi:TATA-box binding protein (TBP) (component of TFIID and TFIIIB)